MSKNSIAQLIFFIALVIAALGVAGTFIETAGHLANGVSEHGNRIEGEASADVEIISEPETGAVWNGSENRVTLLVKNVGADRLSTAQDAVDVVIDGTAVTNESIDVVGSEGWYPGDVVRIRFERPLPDGHHRASVSVDGARDSIEFATGRQPLATFSIDPSPVRTDETTTFNASESYDPDGEIDSYKWDFGADGTNDSSGETVTRSWTDPGEVTVTLTVTDDGGNTDSTTRTFGIYPANWRTFAYWTDDTGYHPATDAPKSNVAKSWGKDVGSTPTDEVVRSSPAVVNGTVYVGTDNGSLYALDRSDGSVRWTATTNGPIRSSPAVVDGTVFVGSRDDRVYAFDVDTGSELWNVSTGSDVDSPPTVENGVVYVGSDDDSLYAIRASNGTIRWSYTTGGDVDGAPAVEEGTVYAGSGDGSLYALDTADGSLVWSKDVGGAVVESSPAVVGDRIYLGVHGTNSTIAINATSRGIVWNVSVGDRVYSSPAVANGTVYVGDGSGTVHALAAETGNTSWTKSTGAEIRSSPAIANGTVVVTSTDGLVYGFDATTGGQYWSYDAGSPITSSPAILNATVYVGIDDDEGDEVIALAGDAATPSISLGTRGRSFGDALPSDDVHYGEGKSKREPGKNRRRDQ